MSVTSERNDPPGARRPARPVVAAPLAVGVCLVAASANHGPGWRLLVGTAGVYACVKAAAVLGPQRLAWRAMPVGARVCYLVVWPGFVARPLQVNEPDVQRVGDAWIRAGWPWMVFGAGVLLALARSAVTGDVAAWTAIAGLLATVHLGCAVVLSGVMRRGGHPVARAFSAPWASTSLRDFWTRRWNRPFVEMDRVVFLSLLAAWPPRVARAAVFVISGLLHELAISFPAGRGWGLPLTYFMLHAGLVTAEPALRIDRWPLPARRLWALAWVLVPLPLLFHAAFRARVVLPFVHVLQENAR